METTLKHRLSGFAGVLGVGGAAALLFYRSQLARDFAEQPEHTVERKVGPLEIRRYDGCVTATVRVSDVLDADRPSPAAMPQLLDHGFERLRVYLRGGNATHERISMSVPVVYRRTSRAVEVSIFLPKDRHISTLPSPHDVDVRLAWTPPRRIAALGYGGKFEASPAKRLERIMYRAIDVHGLHAKSEVELAGYDAPYVLPALRRNEAWIEI